MWNATPDGSIIDETGKVLFFSTNRFIDDICLGDCCFICGAKPGQKPFNNEHILPEWLLRRYNLFAGTITLPNGNKVRYDRYTVPCCAECNSLMGTEIEAPISNAVNAGSEVFADFIVKNCLLIFTWMGLIFLKTHLKDRKFRVHLDQRMGDEKIADQYEWEYLHHIHCIVRCFYTNREIQQEAIGSMLGLPVRAQASQEQFEFGDLYLAQSMFFTTRWDGHISGVQQFRRGNVLVLAKTGKNHWSHLGTAIARKHGRIRISQFAFERASNISDRLRYSRRNLPHSRKAGKSRT